jgi:predicted P-loop ATPase
MIALRRDQLWAEAHTAFLADERWWLEEHEQGLAEIAVATREKYDVWDEILTERIAKLENEQHGPLKSLTLASALELIGVPGERMGDRERERVAASLARLGYKSVPRKVRSETGERVPIRIYRRTEE